jgi:predicted component of viral defense system (DUF524 family)
MLQIFICFALLFHPTTMVASNYFSSQPSKFQCSSSATETCYIEVQKFYIQPHLIKTPKIVHVPQATLVQPQSIIYVEAQPYTNKPHAYQPTACIHLIASSIQEHMTHR